MAPTIGRIVSFKVDEQTARTYNARKDGKAIKAGTVLPAMIVAVELYNAVNLRVFRDAASDGWELQVPFCDVTAGNGVPDGHWYWPPRV
jgi:hypothetical protein